MVCLFSGKGVARMDLISVGMSPKQAWLVNIVLNHAIRTDIQIPEILQDELESLNIQFNQLMQNREEHGTVPH